VSAVTKPPYISLITLTNITIIFDGATIRTQQLSLEETFAGLVTFVPQPNKSYRGFLSSKGLQILSILEEESNHTLRQQGYAPLHFHTAVWAGLHESKSFHGNE
jgi:hypothetical protein